MVNKPKTDIPGKGQAGGNIKRNAMLWLLVLTSSLLLSISFLVPHLGWVSLFAFIPLLAAEEVATQSGKKHFWIYYYTCFLLWNLATTFWICNATVPGMIAAVVLNALQMAIVFRLFRWMRKLASGFMPYLFLIFTWLAWEHAYFDWDVSWPWLVLGNSFATSIKSIQWYEFTGTLGGSFWILLTNTLLFRLMKYRVEGKPVVLSSISAALVVALPIILSHIIFYTYKEPYCEPSSGDGSRQFAVLQPNIDPYTDKFSGMSQHQQNMVLMDLSKEVLAKEPQTNFIIAPESFASRYPYMSLNYPSQHISFSTFYDFIREHNYVKRDSCGLNMIFGAVTEYYYENYKERDSEGKPLAPSEDARYYEKGDFWYERSNSSVFLDSDGGYDFYKKSKLVVLVEKIPFKKLFNLMSRFEIDLGGAIGSFAIQKERSLFTSPDSVKIGTAICYESVYGDYYREYVLNGAHVMSIITNDGWWGDTPGYRQHLSYASLRAIETRRSIARSANTGISAFINQKGEVIEQTEWWKRAYLNESLLLNDKLTVFVRHGDIIGRLSQFLFFLFGLMALSLMLKRTSKAR